MSWFILYRQVVDEEIFQVIMFQGGKLVQIGLLISLLKQRGVQGDQ
ncbi:MAG: hypothetical protein L6R45_32640 [Anaerolineae bacterium]|nr:hypothetical protein [Anaerolineae bacterium]